MNTYILSSSLTLTIIHSTKHALVKLKSTQSNTKTHHVVVRSQQQRPAGIQFDYAPKKSQKKNKTRGQTKAKKDKLNEEKHL